MAAIPEERRAGRRGWRRVSVGKSGRMRSEKTGTRVLGRVGHYEDFDFHQVK